MFVLFLICSHVLNSTSRFTRYYFPQFLSLLDFLFISVGEVNQLGWAFLYSFLIPVSAGIIQIPDFCGLRLTANRSVSFLVYIFLFIFIFNISYTFSDYRFRFRCSISFFVSIHYLSSLNYFLQLNFGFILQAERVVELTTVVNKQQSNDIGGPSQFPVSLYCSFFVNDG